MFPVAQPHSVSGLNRTADPRTSVFNSSILIEIALQAHEYHFETYQDEAI
jgi:hypothetical protein